MSTIQMSKEVRKPFANIADFSNLVLEQGYLTAQKSSDFEALAKPGKYEEVALDANFRSAVNRCGMTVAEALEILDPSHCYGEHPLGRISAFDRQLIRLGWSEAESSWAGPRSSKPIDFILKNTPLSAIMFPEAMYNTVHWEPIIDNDLDPNELIGSTITQKETMTKAVIVDDGQLRNRRMQELSETATPPIATLRHKAYAGSTRTHGMAVQFSREFAQGTPMNILQSALRRVATTERRTYFEHILDVAQNGDTGYGIPAVTVTTAQSLDSAGISEAGQLSYKALSRFYHSKRPTAPDVAIVNINTNDAYLSAVPPADITNALILQQLAAAGYPSVPKPSNTQFLGATPKVIVVPNDVLADNKIIHLNKANAFIRIVVQGGETNEQDYAVLQSTYTQVMKVKDGLFAHPSYDTGASLLSLDI